jgi:hypothetical protein
MDKTGAEHTKFLMKGNMFLRQKFDMAFEPGPSL